MANKRKNWTPEENEVLKNCVKESNTLTEAFKKASDKLGRPVSGVGQHYYYDKKHVLLIHKKEHPKASLLQRVVASIKNFFI
jgi:hypothetical protein